MVTVPWYVGRDLSWWLTNMEFGVVLLLEGLLHSVPLMFMFDVPTLTLRDMDFLLPLWLAVSVSLLVLGP